MILLRRRNWVKEGQACAMGKETRGKPGELSLYPGRVICQFYTSFSRVTSKQQWQELGVMVAEQGDPTHREELMLICYQSGQHVSWMLSLRRTHFHETSLWVDNLQRCASPSQAGGAPSDYGEERFIRTAFHPEQLKRNTRQRANYEKDSALLESSVQIGCSVSCGGKPV